MEHALLTYCSGEYDGRIYVKLLTRSELKAVTFTLIKNGELIAQKHSTREFVMFKNQDQGTYKATAEITFSDNSMINIESEEISALSRVVDPKVTHLATGCDMKGRQELYPDAQAHFLELKLQKGGLQHLLAVPCARIPKSYALIHASVLHKVSLLAFWQDASDEENADRYIIDPVIPDEEIIALAQELETLDYVIYCCVVPIPKKNKKKRRSNHDDGDSRVDVADAAIKMADVTPDFTPLQTYLSGGMGMNVRAAWDIGETGAYAAVRIIDDGLEDKHENLINQITVVTNQDPDYDRSHGTATTGCIVAGDKGFGIIGIARDCRCYFYTDMEGFDAWKLVLSDAVAGDIVTISRGFNTNRPFIFDAYYWERIYTLALRGVIVLLAAGNGGFNLSVPRPNFNDYGDAGNILVGGGNARDGRRALGSNYNHRSLIMNSWGDLSIVSTGYGDLFWPDYNEDRAYTREYGGTSGACALCAGAVALMQSYAIRVYRRILSPWQLRFLNQHTGSDEGQGDGIGYRPNVKSALDNMANIVRDSLYITSDQAYLDIFARDSTGEHLHGLLGLFSRVQIILSEQAWASQIIFPAAERILAGQTLTVTNNSSASVLLILNNQSEILQGHSEKTYGVSNAVWRNLNTFRVTAPEIFMQLASDSIGRMIYEWLLTYDVVELIATQESSPQWIYLPAAQSVWPGRIVVYTNRSSRQLFLMLNTQQVAINPGTSNRFVASSSLWYS